MFEISTMLEDACVQNFPHFATDKLYFFGGVWNAQPNILFQFFWWVRVTLCTDSHSKIPKERNPVVLHLEIEAHTYLQIT
jgi:hypothetical protein